MSFLNDLGKFGSGLLDGGEQLVKSVTDVPGRVNNELSRGLNKVGIGGWVGDNPLEAAGAVVGTAMAAPFIASGVSALGGSEFASGSLGGKFGNLSFGDIPSFSGGAPTSAGGLGEYGGLTPEGGWKQTTEWGNLSTEGKTDWGGIMQSVGNALSHLDTQGISAPRRSAPVSFKGAKLPAQQYDAGALQNQMAAQEFQNIGVKGNNLNIPGKKDLNALLGLA